MECREEIAKDVARIVESAFDAASKYFKLSVPQKGEASKKYKIYKERTSHMISGLKNGLSHHAFKWTEEKLRIAALKYSTRSEFKKQNPRAYDAAVSRGLMDSICSHMRKNNKKSTYEIEILTEVKKIHKQAKSLSKRNISIPNKPHIKGFDIDIFIPELNKGIEFDGDYWHSYKVMRSNTKRKNWPDEDIQNYHEIKDTYFKSIGIEILHIKESDWIKNKNECLNKIWKFLKCV